MKGLTNAQVEPEPEVVYLTTPVTHLSSDVPSPVRYNAPTFTHHVMFKEPVNIVVFPLLDASSQRW